MGNKANLRDLTAATGLVILLKFDLNHRFFSLCDFEILCMTSKNNRAPLPYYIKLCVSFQIHRWIQTEVTLRKRSIRVKMFDFFVLCDLEIWWMTLENNRAPILYYTKLCASFQIHRWMQIGVTVRKRSIWVKISNFLSRVTLKFDGWPWKTIGHLFYVASSVVHHFTAISEFKLELQSGDAQFGSKSTIFFSRVTMKFNRWPSKTIGHLFHATSSFVHHFVAIGELKLELQSENAQSGLNSTIFRAVRSWNLTDDLVKQ